MRPAHCAAPSAKPRTSSSRVAAWRRRGVAPLARPAAECDREGERGSGWGKAGRAFLGCDISERRAWYALRNGAASRISVLASSPRPPGRAVKPLPSPQPLVAVSPRAGRRGLAGWQQHTCERYLPRRRGRGAEAVADGAAMRATVVDGLGGLRARDGPSWVSPTAVAYLPGARSAGKCYL